MKRKKPEIEPQSEPAAGAAASEKPAPEPSGSRETFEEAFEVVEKSVARLERGDLSLEESLGAYEQGLNSLRRCYEVLARAQKRIEVLSADMGGLSGAPGASEGPEAPAWKPASSHPALKQALDHVEREEDVPSEP